MRLNTVRFTSPVRANSRVRGRFVLRKLDDVEGGIQCTWTVTFEIEGAERPACMAEHVVRRYFRKLGSSADAGTPWRHGHATCNRGF